MAGKLRTATSKNGKVVVREEYFGIDPSNILFPGLSSCISVTADSPHGLIGLHITVATEDHIVSEMLSKITDCVGPAYIVGQIQEFKSKTFKGFNTRKKISSKIRGAAGGIHKVYFYDIGTLSKDADVLVTKNGNGLDFGWAHIRKVGWEFLTDTSGFTAIAATNFMSR